MSDEYIDVQQKANIATITINRPEKRNALFGRMRRNLAEALEHAGSDTNVRVIIVKGAGEAFCAGGDVAAFNDLMERRDEQEWTRLIGAGRRVVTAIRQITKPVIASIRGAAIGAGFNLALACDIRIAAESARFSESFVRFGLHPDWGGTYFLPRLVAANIACELFFLGEMIDARRAYELQLVNRVVPDAELERETQALAERLCSLPRESIASVKQAVYMSHAATLEAMLQYETEAQLRCFHTANAREGTRAFLEKREPRFNNRR
jgi:2-(1,2-epoxy-1,2-dihydrophenyl)acetyl-CoA isomerase